MKNISSKAVFWIFFGAITGFCICSVYFIIKSEILDQKSAGISYVASQYSENKFNSIDKGMTCDQVLGILGYPAGSAASGKWDVWCYVLQGDPYVPEIRRILYLKDRKVDEILSMGKVKK